MYEFVQFGSFYILFSLLEPREFLKIQTLKGSPVCLFGKNKIVFSDLGESSKISSIADVVTLCCRSHIRRREP